MLVAIPATHPRTAATRVIQTSDAWPEPKTHPISTWRVLSTMSPTMTTSAATSSAVQP